MGPTPVLDKARIDALRLATGQWFELQVNKNASAKRIDSDSALINHFLKGRKNTLPINALVGLWGETQNPVFLMTVSERARYRQVMGKRFAGWPDRNKWPPQERVASQPTDRSVVDTGSPTDLDDLKSLLRVVNNQLGRLADLPADDPRRQAARRQMVEPAMAIFRNASALGLEFPDEFSDLLDQLNLATRINGGK